MKAVIVANGRWQRPAALDLLLAEARLIIAADGGAAHCERIGVTPGVVVGDFDSLDPDLLARCQRAGCEILRHPPQKDATDLELALDIALARKAKAVTILGALGGRWDMSLANILLAAQHKYREIEVVLVEGRCRMQVLHPGKPHVVSSLNGKLLSLLAVGGDAAGVTLSGFRYPLNGQGLVVGSSLGVSNELAGAEAAIRHESGILLCVQETHETPDHRRPVE